MVVTVGGNRILVASGQNPGVFDFFHFNAASGYIGIPDTVDVGNDVDSMYGLRVFLRASGEYVITEDNYSGSSIIVHRWTP